MTKVRFIDLFAGIGGIRQGFENAFISRGFSTECVLTSEIKPHAVKVLQANNHAENYCGDITKVNSSEIPDFDFLLAGFPCQAFSYAGKRLGFMDTRGTMFFEVERILRDKRPFGFILENVEGLVTHDRDDNKKPIGKTLTTILNKLDELNYCVTWKVLNAKDFGLAQDRKRIYIAGTKKTIISLDDFPQKHGVINDIIEKGLPLTNTKFTHLLLEHYKPEQLYGKSIKDKRGGSDNIHSWDIELKGPVSKEQKELLNALFRERRKKKWAEEYGIQWMDGMPLTTEQIATFYNHNNLQLLLDDLVTKGYLKKEHPKDLIIERTMFGEKQIRKQNVNLPLGYNIVAGKLSFEINKILSPKGIAPTLVAMDMKKNFVIDNDGLRPISLREGLRLFGYPENFKFPVSVSEGFDLLGNTVAVPVIEAIASRLTECYTNKQISYYDVNSTTSISETHV